MPVIRISDLMDPRVAEYHGVADPAAIARSGRFVAEGRLVVERVIARTVEVSAFTIESVLLSDAALTAMEAVIRAVPQVPVFVCPASEFGQLAGLNLHRGCLALVQRPPEPSVESLVGPARTLLVLERVGNPDNIGGIFRSAAAFGVDAILLSPGCGDPLYRKAIRTSMAAALTVPFAWLTPWPDRLQQLRADGYEIAALTPQPPSLTLAEYADIRRQGGRPRLALLLGTEGPGLTSDALAQADVRVRIPMVPAVDSLNVAVACGIALSHLAPAPVS